jgi:hypothetical protein
VFVKPRSNLPSPSFFDITNTIQSSSVGGPVVFGFKGDTTGLSIGPNDPSCAEKGELGTSFGVTWFSLTGKRTCFVMVEAKSAGEATTSENFQLAVKVTSLSPGMNLPEVEDLKRRLNCSNPTRLQRLTLDTQYDVLTMARVMEFQFQHGLIVDGTAGPKTLSRLSRSPSNCPSVTPAKGRCILVDLIHGELIAFHDGTQDLRISPIKGGSASDPSTRGVFPMTSRRLRHHTSSKFPIPPGNMDFSLFYNGAEAIHQGPGTLESHGCIHVSPPHAESVFTWAGKHDVLVIVTKLSP